MKLSYARIYEILELVNSEPNEVILSSNKPIVDTNTLDIFQHVEILLDGGFIKGSDWSSKTHASFKIKSLTLEGYKLLQDLNSRKGQKRFLKFLKISGVAVTEVAISSATNLLVQYLQHLPK